MRTVGIALTLLSSLIGTTMLAQQPTQGMHWVGTWASAQMLVDGPDLSAEDFRDATLRQVVHVSSGGSRIRLRLSNAFGTAPLQIQMVHVAKPASVVNCRIDPSSDKPLRFSGNTAVTIPPGAEYLSDPIDFPVASLTDLTVTMYLETPSLHQTGHIAAHTTSCLGARNLVTAADIPDAKKFQHWFYLAGVEVEPTRCCRRSNAGRFDHRRNRFHVKWQRSLARCSGSSPAGWRRKPAVERAERGHRRQPHADRWRRPQRTGSPGP
jgi:hypothetical protein